jgi:hypothetical protein
LQPQGGRHIKKVPKAERTQLGVIVGGKTKSRLLKAMKESGRTISREAEHQIEKAFAYDSMLASMKRRDREFLDHLDRIRVQRLSSLQPGEFLIFTCELMLDKDQVMMLQSRIKESLPSGVAFMFVTAGLDVFRSTEIVTADGSKMIFGNAG